MTPSSRVSSQAVPLATVPCFDSRLQTVCSPGLLCQPRALPECSSLQGVGSRPQVASG